MLLRTYLDHCLVSCWLGDPRFPRNFERTSCAVVFRKSRTARHCNASVLDGVLSRMLASMCLGRACGPVLGILVVNAVVKRHTQHAACPPLAVHCNAVARARATGWPWFQSVFHISCFTYMMLLGFTFTRQCVSPEYDYMLCPCVSGVHEGIAMQVPVLLCPLLPFCIESPSHLKHLQPVPLVWICS